MQLRIRLIVAFLLTTCGSALAQQTPRNNSAEINYGFVSPNTREGLKLEDAIRGMDSTEEANLLRRAKNLGCVVKRKISTLPAVGSWSDGAEHSILLRTKTDEATIRYLMSRLGRDANQKAILYFHPNASGTATLYSVRPPSRLRGFAAISGILDRAGIVFRTLVPTKQRTFIYVVDLEGTLAAKVMDAAKRLRASYRARRGNANFIGDDAVREKGQVVFAQEVKDYETKHPNLPPPCIGN
jgi:hypothetical protein